MKLFNKRYILTILFIFIAVFFIYKIYKFSVLSVKTETAECSLTQDVIDADGFAVRDEQIITWNGAGKVSYRADDGEKVSNGQVISDIYDNYEEVAKENEIQNIQKEIDMLTAFNSSMICDFKEPDIIDKEINDNILSVEKALSNDSYIDVFKYKNRLSYLLSARKKFLKNEGTLDERINVLSSKKKYLESICKGSKEKITAPNTGWFGSFLDGYENVVDYNNVKKCSDINFNIDSIEKKDIPESYIGKILNSSEWYIICSVPKEKAEALNIGNECELKLPFMVSQGIPCKIHDLNDDKSGNINIIISCNYMDKDILKFRKGKIKIKINEYYGFKVKKSAICYKESDDGDNASKITGVNTKYGNVITFKKVNIIYSSDDYVVVSLNSSDDKTNAYLKTGDKVIIEGTNLYDGKLIKV